MLGADIRLELASMPCALPAFSALQPSRWFVFTAAEAAGLPIVGPELLFTNADILSGGLDGCPTYNASTCTLGIAAFVARRRALTAQGVQTLPLPMLQRASSFTKLHPLDWGFILDLYPSLGITTALSGFEVPPRHFAMSYQSHKQWGTIVDNSVLPMGHSMRRWVDGVYFDSVTKVQVLSARILAVPLATIASNVVNSIFGARTFGGNFTHHSVVLVYDSTPLDMLIALRVANAEITKTSNFFPTVICRHRGSADSVTKVNDTWLVELKTSADKLHRLRIHEDSSNSTRAVNVSIETESLALPSSMIDTDEYRRDQALLKVERDKAVQNNPYMGDIAGPMPAPWTSTGGFLCREGECAMGSFFADSIRGVTNADIGLFSGPWLHGNGWPQGKVTLRDLYGTFPWTEQLAQGRFLGVTIFELFNHTIQEAGFDALQSSSELATYHLMQISGMRVKYTFGRSKHDRLVSIDIQNKVTGDYEPLERLKLYTVTSDAYLGRQGPIMKLYLRDARYAGEAGMALSSLDLHQTIGEFLRGLHGTYLPGIKGRLINATSTSSFPLPSMRDWNHRLRGCSPGMAMNESIGTCVVCPAGFEAQGGASGCVPIPPPAPLLSDEARVVIIAVAALVGILLIGAGVKGFYVWRRYQRLRYCPRDSGVAIAAFFVTVRNEVALRERHPALADAALRQIERIVVEAAPRHKCFVARKLKAHFLVVSSDAAAAMVCAAAIFRATEEFEWGEMVDAVEDTRSTIVAKSDRKKLRALHHAHSSAALRHDRNSKTAAGGAATGTTSGHRSRNMSPVVPPPIAVEISERTATAAERTAAEILTPPSVTPSRSSASTPSTTRRRCEKLLSTFEPRIAIGLAFGYSRVDYDEDVDVYSYSGPVLDAAVTVADLANDRQILATEALVSTAGEAAVAAVDTEEFIVKSMACPFSETTTDVSLIQCNVLGCVFRHFDIKTSDSDDAAGALAAALETAAGGLTSRKIGAVSWTVPALRGGRDFFQTRAEHMKASEDIVAALLEACGDNADITSTSDGVFTAVVNGAAVRTAQVAVSTVEIARAGLVVLAHATEHESACGVAIGTSITGTINNDVFVAGAVTERARMLATAAFNHPAAPGLLIAEDSIADLEGYALAAVDVISWPKHCALGDLRKRAVANALAVIVYTVESAPSTIDADEWLYQLDAALRGNPHTAMNNRLIAALGRPVSVTASAAGNARPFDASTTSLCDYGVVGLVETLTRYALVSPTPSPPLVIGIDGPPPRQASTAPLKRRATATERFAQRRAAELCFAFPNDEGDLGGEDAASALPLPLDSPSPILEQEISSPSDLPGGGRQL